MTGGFEGEGVALAGIVQAMLPPTTTSRVVGEADLRSVRLVQSVLLGGPGRSGIVEGKQGEQLLP